MTVTRQRCRFNEGGEGTGIAFVPNLRTSLFRRDPFGRTANTVNKVSRACGFPSSCKRGDHSDLGFENRLWRQQTLSVWRLWSAPLSLFVSPLTILTRLEPFLCVTLKKKKNDKVMKIERLASEPRWWQKWYELVTRMSRGYLLTNLNSVPRTIRTVTLKNEEKGQSRL